MLLELHDVVSKKPVTKCVALVDGASRLHLHGAVRFAEMFNKFGKIHIEDFSNKEKVKILNLKIICFNIILFL